MKRELKMREKIKNALYLILLGIILILAIPLVDSATIGVSPSVIEFNNMLRDGYAEGHVTVSVAADKPVTITASARGEIAPWLEFNKSFQVDGEHKLRLVVRPPDYVANGEHLGYLRVQTSPLGDPSDQVGSSVEVGIDVKVSVIITDQQILLCDANSFRASNAEKGFPVLFAADVFNQGNVILKPHGNILILDKRQEQVIKSVNFEGEGILPTLRKSVVYELDTKDLSLGQYWADFKITECDSSDLLTFDILEKGGLSTSGILRTVTSATWVNVGQEFPVFATFENDGENPVTAKFKGNALLSGQAVKILESNEALVRPGEIVNLTMLFTPAKPGRYILSGKVYYANKETYEKFGVVNVVGKEFNYKILLLILLILAILFVTYKIIKERQRKARTAR
ncbi:MAG: hypothetical protein AABX59_01570 [Nanoarchaeota archaeon]